MRGNTVSTLRRRTSPMAAFDRLPPDLRCWLHDAALPWSPASALKLWHRALRQAGGDPARARAALDAVQARTIARDARRIWGRDHPQAAGTRGVA